MSRKREQRLRRKARAQVRAAELAGAEQLKKLAGLRVIAHSAMVYVGAIDAPNPHEPWDVAKKRDVLVDLVHAYLDRPEKGQVRQDPQVVRAVYMAPEQKQPVAEGDRFPLHTLPPPPAVLPARAGSSRTEGCEERGAANLDEHREAGPIAQLVERPPQAGGWGSTPLGPRHVSEVEVKRRELHNAAKKLGAEANKRVLNHARVAELEAEHEAASVAYAVARAAGAGRRSA